MATKKQTVKSKEVEALANQVYEDSVTQLAKAALGMTFLKLRLQNESDLRDG